VSGNRQHVSIIAGAVNERNTMPIIALNTNTIQCCPMVGIDTPHTPNPKLNDAATCKILSREIIGSTHYIYKCNKDIWSLRYYAS